MEILTIMRMYDHKDIKYLTGQLWKIFKIFNLPKNYLIKV